LTQKKSYSRYFIILQEDEKGYAVASDKLPSGYAKLEMKNEKCKISFYVQNLKKESAPYYIALICNKKDANKIIKLGELNIDEHGKAEITHENALDNIAGLGVPMDKISGAAIIRFIDTNMVSVMCGFIGSDIADWKRLPLVEPVVNREIEVQDTKSVFDKYEDEIERLKQKNNPIQENNPEPVQPPEEVKPEEIVQPGEQTEPQQYLEDTQEFNAEDPAPGKQEQTEEEYTEEGEAKQYTMQLEDDYPIGPIGDFFRDTVSEFEELRHVSHEIKRCKWYKVDAKNLEYAHNQMNYNTYTVVFYPMMGYYPYIKKHGHFIMGHKCNKEGKLKYLVYGIPGTKSKADQPFGGKSGFVTWIPMKEKEKECEMGYWLMFYDFRDSSIVIPVR